MDEDLMDDDLLEALPAAPAPETTEVITQHAEGTHRAVPSPGHIAEAAAEGSRTMGLAEKLGITLGIVALQALLIWLVWLLFRKLSNKVKTGAGSKIKPLTIKNFRILTSQQIIEVILFLLRIAKYLVTAFQLFITVPIIFSFYPETEALASTIFGYILNPLKKILMDAIAYVPNIITIVIFILITTYVLKGLKFFAGHIDKGKLVLPGFYSDWAWPTYNILKVFLWAFTIAVIYPYLPGSESRIFQGVSVFVGIIISLGSSSVIGNLMAGMVITYMRPFVIGDRIKIKDITGFVVEKSPFVIRMRNTKNEYITFPNLTVLNSEITNFSTSVEGDALLLHPKITMGYDVPWRQVYDLLVAAAGKTPKVEEQPKPFVLQTALNDFYAVYELNVYTKDVDHFQRTYSLLYQNIQDVFTEAGISLFSPHYEVSIQGKTKTAPAPSLEKKE